MRTLYQKRFEDKNIHFLIELRKHEKHYYLKFSKGIFDKEELVITGCVNARITLKLLSSLIDVLNRIYRVFDQDLEETKELEKQKEKKKKL